MQVWAVGTVRNEVDLIRINVLHHLGQGIDHFLILDDGSTDGTADLLNELSRMYPVEWHAVAGPFRQHQLLTNLAHSAVARGATWIVPIDADEFWYAPEGTVREVLQDATAGAIAVSVVNFIQGREHVRTREEAILNMTRRVSTPIGPVEAIADHVESERWAYVEILYPPKWISRTSPELEIGWGNHYVGQIQGDEEHTTNIVCLHAPLRSLETLSRKADLGRPSAEIAEYLDKAWHLRRWRRLAHQGRLEAEWRANSHVDGVLDVYGRLHHVIEDFRLQKLLAPHVTGGRPSTPAGSAPTMELPDSVRARIVDRMRPIEGWFEEREADLLVQVVHRALHQLSGPHHIVEVGSYCGRATMALAGAVEASNVRAIVHAVDPHEGLVGAIDGTLAPEQRLPTYDRFLAVTDGARRAGIVNVVRARSTDVVWNDPIGVLVLDGMHDYLSVTADVTHFSPFVVEGGFVAFHDRSEDFPGVAACIRDLLNTRAYDVQEEVGSLVVLRRTQPRASLPTDAEFPRELGADRLRTQIAVRDDTIGTLRARLRHRDDDVKRLEEQARSLGARVSELIASKSWRISAPLRALYGWLRNR
jgi:hypothetical protein